MNTAMLLATMVLLVETNNIRILFRPIQTDNFWILQGREYCESIASDSDIEFVTDL